VMGCGESKIKRIHLTGESDWDSSVSDTSLNHARDLWRDATEKITKQSGVVAELMSNVPVIDVVDKSRDWTGLDTKGVLPNSLLATIPSSDLGESLDCRPTKTIMSDTEPVSRSAPVSSTSLDSGDSGYDEYEDENAHIITEHSAKDLVNNVIQEFKPVDLPELLVITGRACTRILSGYEKTKKEEQNILASLRAEGLLAKPGGKAQGGISFEIVDMAAGDLKESFISTSSLLPGKKLSRLEQRRENVKKGEVDLDTELAEADERRKAMETERIKKLAELSGLDKIEKARTSQVEREQSKQEQAMQQRREKLETMRSKLKEKTKKVDMLRLKKALALDSSYQEADFSSSFFDD